jgi:hypothetical protein
MSVVASQCFVIAATHAVRSRGLDAIASAIVFLKGARMRKILFALTVLSSLTLVATASAQTARPVQQRQQLRLLSEEHKAKVREEIRLQRQRAQELEPVITRDKQARRDVEVTWTLLERHARDLHARANDFRTWAANYNSRVHDDFLQFATELDQFATHDEENARTQHEIGDRLDRLVQSETAQHDWHNAVAQRLEEGLNSW